MALLMAAFFQLTADRAPRGDGWLTTLGRTPMFFYLLHFPLLVGASSVLGVHHQLGLAATYAGAACVVAVLYPACRWYRPFKASGRHVWTRYV
jgi:peptidoglycan/LPS O-acetylase OafA/YrhL